MSLPRSGIIKALLSIGLDGTSLFDFWSGSVLNLDFFDPCHERANVLTGLFGVTDMGAFPQSSSKSKSESELELEYLRGNLATTNGGKEPSSEESSELVSKPPAAAHGPY